MSHCAAGANFTINVWRKWKYYLLRYDSVIGWVEAGGHQMEQPTPQAIIYKIWLGVGGWLTTLAREDTGGVQASAQWSPD